MARSKPTRTVLVTGAAKRIGRAIALDFASIGWHVGIHCNRSRAEADALLAEIERAGGRGAVLPADLNDPDAVADLVFACTRALAPPQCLINSASLFLEDHIGSLTPALWEQHHRINLQAPVFLAQAMAAALPDGATGTIINIIDQRVWRPSPEFFSYALAKAGLWQATPMLAQALAPRIRVNAIAPGPVLQSIHQTAEQFQAEQRGTILERGTTPAEIVAAIHFILAAPAMTGQTIALDGGQHLAWRGPGDDPGRDPVAIHAPTWEKTT